MRIETMTATFGKLEGETLTLRPGLNVITGENEWGKSTWCAFLLAMLYGMDTRSKSTKTALSPKEHYAPWSGSPMAGRMELEWKGRRITLERTTKGRIPLGEFRAYETETNLPVSELTAENCGQMLLGAEREVFCRAGFIRQEDLPVTKNEALRARLNALVTTGDDSGEGAKLAQKLKELKNKCRYNQSGLLPQAEKRLAELEEDLQRQERLEAQIQALDAQRVEAEGYLRALQNHQAALDQAKANQDARQVENARRDAERRQREYEKMEAICQELPTRQEAENRLRDLEAHARARRQAEEDRAGENLPPEPPKEPEIFQGLTAREAMDRAQADGKAYKAIVGKGFWSLVILAGLSMAVGIGVLLAFGNLVPALVAFGLGALLLGASLLVGGKEKERQKALAVPYGGGTPDQWEAKARAYGDALERYSREQREWLHRQTELEQQFQGLEDQRAFLCEGHSPEEMEELCRQVLQSWDRLAVLGDQKDLAQSHFEELSAMAAPMMHTEIADGLTLSREETEKALKSIHGSLLTLNQALGGKKERLEALGSRETLEGAWQKENRRVQTLRQYEAALTLAQETLTQAAQSLQRRFAPKISAQAQAYMAKMTEGRYDRVTLTEDLALEAGAAGETGLRDILWRSNGTVDQLYLSLRLAVAQTLTPEAPLILDDALVRFDDRRLKRALEVLEELGEEKQVLLFTCQTREREALSGNSAFFEPMIKPVKPIAHGGPQQI